MARVNYDNIEFNPPSPYRPLLKAIDVQYAKLLLDKGNVRLHKISYFRHIEDDKLRDKDEGIGVLNCRGTSVKTWGAMDTFVWCMSQARLSPRELANKFDHNSVLILNEPAIFARRLIAAAYEFGSQWSLQCRPVTYDKGAYRERSPEDDDDDEPADFYIFQKDPVFSHEIEYRFALTDIAWNMYPQDFITLHLEPCHDIAEIVETKKIPTKG